MRAKFAFFVLLFLASPAHAATVQEVKSDGGITAWLVEEHALPIISARTVFIDAGTSADPKGKDGRTGFTRAAMMEGAGPRDALAFTQALEEHAIELSLSTDEDLFSTQLKTITEHRDIAFALLSDVLAHPRFDASAIERVRMQHLAKLKQLAQSPDYALARGFNDAAFGDHPYGHRAEGTEASLKAIARNDLVAFHEHYLTRENIRIAVVGDITAEELKPLLDKTFGALPAHYAPEAPTAEIAMQSAGKTVEVARDIPQTLIVVGAQGVKRRDPRYFDAYLLNYIVGGGSLTSRLSHAIREEKGLAYSVGSSLDPMLHGAVWRAQFGTRTAQADDALATMNTTLEDVAKNGVTEKELKEAKQFITGSFVLALDSNASLANFLIAMQLNDLGRDYLDKRNSLIEAVKLEDVNALARELFAPGKLLTVRVGNKQDAPHGQ